MFNKSLSLAIASLILLCCAADAQQAASAPSSVVPQLVNYSGKAVDGNGNVISGIAGITFAIYKDQYGGAPLWMEMQNVTADENGNYAVQLGAATGSHGEDRQHDHAGCHAGHQRRGDGARRTQLARHRHGDFEGGKNSQPEKLTASSYSSSTNTARTGDCSARRWIATEM